LRQRWFAIAVVGLLGAAVACSGDGPDGGGATPATAGDTSTSAPDDQGSDGEVDRPPPATISEALAARSAVIAENQLAIEAAVQSCMVEQGFKYTPNPGGGGEFVAQFDGASFAEQFGYGVTTMTGASAADLGLGAGLPDDPNQQYVQSLSESQRAAYMSVLYGAAGGTSGFVVGSGDGTGVSGGGAPVTASGGCIGEANQQVYGTDQPLALNHDIFDQLHQIGAQVDADPRLIEAWRDWASCMASEGYPFSDESEIIRDLSARFTAITGQDSSRSGGTVAIGPNAALEEPNYDEAALAALQAEELAIAGAGAHCRAEHVDDVESEVRDGYERSFLADNPELLEQLLGPARGS